MSNEISEQLMRDLHRRMSDDVTKVLAHQDCVDYPDDGRDRPEPGRLEMQELVAGVKAASMRLSTAQNVDEAESAVADAESLALRAERLEGELLGYGAPES